MIDPEEVWRRQQREWQVRQEFRRRWHRQIFVALVVGGVFALYAFFVLAGDGTFFGLDRHETGFIFALAVLAAVIFRVVNWRCPECGASLGSEMSPAFCSRCGGRLW
jgi:hypothetical protein